MIAVVGMTGNAGRAVVQEARPAGRGPAVNHAQHVAGFRTNSAACGAIVPLFAIHLYRATTCDTCPRPPAEERLWPSADWELWRRRDVFGR